MNKLKYNVGDRLITKAGIRGRTEPIEFVVHQLTETPMSHEPYYVGEEAISRGGFWEREIEGLAPVGDPDDSAVNHPKHYNSHPSGVECITIARHHNFNIGNVFKYLWRIGLKGEDAATREKRVEEIDKAIFYLQDERARILA